MLLCLLVADRDLLLPANGSETELMLSLSGACVCGTVVNLMIWTHTGASHTPAAQLKDTSPSNHWLSDHLKGQDPPSQSTGIYCRYMLIQHHCLLLILLDSFIWTTNASYCIYLLFVCTSCRSSL